MSQTSRTGLIASPTKKIYRSQKVSTIQLRAFARPAPFVLKPFAGLYNPYPYGCSLLCNHPTDSEAKELLKRVKDSWATEGKNLLLTEEIEAIRAGFENFQPLEKNVKHVQINALDSVPEELFRRYTETDSRPLTPAPTLASAATRASGSRRCVTPDPAPTNQIREKTLLILDLRRSHSQETLSWHGSSSLQEPPIIRIQRVPTRIGSFDESASPKAKSPTHLLTHPNASRSSTPSSVKALKKKNKEVEEPPIKEKQEEKKSDDEEEAEDEFIKRRGKKRRKKREGSGAPAFQTSVDPETQVATIGPDSHNPSARPSLVPATPEETLEVPESGKRSARPSKCWDIDSFLDVEILKQLRRELDEEVIDNEFNQKRRTALQEALKTIPKDKINCEALIKVQNELKLPPVNTELWLSLPRVFSRSSARFELPLDSRTLETMTPLQYIQNNVSITSPRKLLYNCIFNKFKIDELEATSERKIRGKDIQSALNLMMGKAMTQKQATYIRDLIGWRDDDVMDFKTFCGLCALCERLLAPEYCAQLPDRKSDPCHEIETADFEALTRKLHGKKVDKNLVEILQGIKTR
ncbi:uncharacterized protein LOC103314071 isoform X1 [Tribolium castaneum]|uniref:uncharacterized protein LOC103314071 isoform X1 n=1 Tax=Tribolium castaneum TaxID=7070 RepID=UPI00046C073C|nr:PREDICTED: uncharacterized protein LOC103314071 isoform X2 [Tribolium castaneum]|eukprot:XP_008197167.1 PREDICTED: uncharacterized protein LOC103314071 isoform X2 [Tribolium castaneum]